MQYIRAHIPDLTKTIKSTWKMILFFVLVVCAANLYPYNLNGMILSLIGIPAFCFVAILVLFLFTRTVDYKTYRRSSIQYQSIKPFVLNEMINVKVEPSVTRIGVIKRIQNWFSSNNKEILYDFDHTDIFETSNSIFLFPIKRSAEKGLNVLYTEYYAPIRLCNDRKEYISGIRAVQMIDEYDDISKGENRNLKFIDPVYHDQVSLILYP